MDDLKLALIKLAALINQKFVKRRPPLIIPVTIQDSEAILPAVTEPFLVIS